jgi:ribosomal protein S18 acetylase RimI-like enzyme
MRLRAPRREEAEAVHAVILARDMADIGRPDSSVQDVRADWELPHVELERDVFVVEDDDGALIGWADVGAWSARVAVHPDHERRGVGTLLRSAVEARTRARGFPVCQQIIPANTGAVAHLRAAGYAPIQFHQRMRAALDDLPAAPAAPVRRFDLETEGRAMHELFEEAFAQIANNEPRSYESWYSDVAARAEPMFRLALDAEQGLAGLTVGERRADGAGYVAQLAVARRGRGHGRTLLLTLIDAFRAAGLRTAELSVAGTNAPATGLYASVGFRPHFRIERWELTRSSG